MNFSGKTPEEILTLIRADLAHTPVAGLEPMAEQYRGWCRWLLARLDEQRPRTQRDWNP